MMGGPLSRWMRRWLDVRPGEFFPAAVMAIYLFLAITAYYVVKPIRNSLFVERVGADNLPFVYILTALVVGAIASYYARQVDRLRRLSLLLGTFGVLGGNHLLFWWLLRQGGFLTSGAFYIWVKLYPLLLVSQFWLVANDLFDTRQAKRLFGLIGTGGILGGITGSAAVGQFATRVGTQNLLPLSAAIFVLCALIVMLLASRYPVLRQRPTRPGPVGDPEAQSALTAWGELRASSHLQTIALLLGATIVVSTIVDWQFNKGVELFIAGEDEKTAYFGKFFAATNVASVLVQFLLTSWILRTFGVGIGMLLLPLGLLTGSLGILLHPALWTTTLAKATDGTLRYSLDQSTRELLFLPVPAAAKYRVKPLIDMVVYRGGTGLGGILLLLGTSVASLSVREMSLVVGALTAAWLAVTVRMRGEFKESVKKLLEVQPVSPDDRATLRLDPLSRRELVEALDSAEEPRLAYALALLENASGPDLEPKLIPLLSHPSQRVRGRALRVLFESRGRRRIPEAREMLTDPAMEVRVEAIRCICHELGADPLARLRAFLANRDERLKAPAVACYVNQFGKKAWPTAETLFAEMLSTRRPEGAERRALVAEAIGLLENAPTLHRFLEPLFADPDPRVRRIALASAARLRDPNLVPFVASRLLGPDHPQAVHTLTAYGAAAGDPLVSLLRDRMVPPRYRAEIMKLVTKRRDPALDGKLLRSVRDLSPDLRTLALQELVLEGRGSGERRLSERDVEPILAGELSSAYKFVGIQAALAAGGRELSLAAQVASERREEALHRAFLALALLYGPEDIFAAESGLTASSPQARRAAFELLDNVLKRWHRRALAPLCDPERPATDAVAHAARLLGGVPASRSDALRQLRRSGDPWAAVVAWYSSDERRDPPHIPDCAVRAPFVAPGPTDAPIEQLLPREPHHLRALVARVDTLRTASPFRSARSEDLVRIVRVAEECRADPWETLFCEGEPAKALLVLLEGEVRVYQNAIEIGALRPVACLDPVSVVTGLPHLLTARTACATRFLAIPSEDLREILRANPRLAEAALDDLAAETEAVGHLAHRSTVARTDSDESIRVA